MQPPHAATNRKINPDATKILITAPEFSKFPEEIDPAGVLKAYGGGVRRVFDMTFNGLWERGYDVHAIIPEYYALFAKNSGLSQKEFDKQLTISVMHPNIHLIDDGVFIGAQRVYDDASYGLDKLDVRRAIHFSKGIVRLSRSLNRAYPDAMKIYQLNDWMTALAAPGIKAWDRRWNDAGLGVPGKAKVEMKWHNGFSAQRPLRILNKQGINTQRYHKDFFYLERMPSDDHVRDMYELTLDFLASGIHASDFTTGVSEGIVREAIDGTLEAKGPGVMKWPVAYTICDKAQHDLAFHVMNALEPDATPDKNPLLDRKYGTADIMEGKAHYHKLVQERFDLPKKSKANIYGWIHRMNDDLRNEDGSDKGVEQKGLSLYLQAIPEILKIDPSAQFVFVADGTPHRNDQLAGLKAGGLPVRVVGYNDKDASMLLAGMDFLMMPSWYEPGGIPQREGLNYGTLPIVMRTGGLASIRDWYANPDDFDGFVFDNHDLGGLLWGVKNAVAFSKMGEEHKKYHLQRIRERSLVENSIDKMIDKTITIYEQQLGQALVLRE